MPPTFMTCLLLFYLATVSEYCCADFSYPTHFPTPRASLAVQLICYTFSSITGHLPNILSISCYPCFLQSWERDTGHFMCAWPDFLGVPYFLLFPICQHIKKPTFFLKAVPMNTFQIFFKWPQNWFEGLVHIENRKMLIIRNKK